MQSVPITTNNKSLNPAHGELSSILHLGMKFVTNLQLFGSFSGLLHQQNWPPWYNWNYVQSGVKHHNPNPSIVDGNMRLVLIWLCTSIEHLAGNREPHRWCNGQRDRLGCGTSWVSALVGRFSGATFLPADSCFSELAL